MGDIAVLAPHKKEIEAAIKSLLTLVGPRSPISELKTTLEDLEGAWRDAAATIGESAGAAELAERLMAQCERNEQILEDISEFRVQETLTKEQGAIALRELEAA